jgi:two-component system, cell cycle sensor histidine kinase and response regulator CckA
MNRPHIMVVEDEGIVAMDLQDSLNRLGYPGVEIISTGEEAMAKAAQSKPDLILMDIRLGPGMDGIDAAKGIGEKLDIPIIYLTAYTDDKTIARAKQTEPFGYLVKPFMEKEVQTTIEMTLYKHSMEKKLRQREQWLAATLRSIGDGVIATRPDGKVLFMNAEAERMTAWREADALEKNVRQILHIVAPEEVCRPESPFWTAMERGQAVEMPERTLVMARDGRVFPAEDSAAPILGRTGEINGVVIVFRDVSGKAEAAEALRQAEEENRHSRKLESLGRLAGGIAHDFNNLLAAINGFSELILSGMPGDDPYRPHVQEIRLAGERAASLTQRLLSFGRKQILIPRLLDLNVVVEGMAGMLARLLGANVKLETRLERDLPRIKSDAGQIDQVIMNLVVNARDAMPKEGGRIILGTGKAEADRDSLEVHPPDPGFTGAPGRYVVLSVSDNGVGMDDKTKARIFEPFFTTKEQGRGTGLGLSMIYGFVKQSSGCVTVSSEPGKGSVFRVYFPAAEE